ncbi:DUF1499 domain-containing protein [Sneathiella limimaris]|uniref:DUF1499 domain-containing protein n=1 Tax=Sneathiella limimaris TaxID=1964213 RepID=UPI00146C098E|nr:DUF1499 domain-containing protein [Sneathiella limimaris]
MTSNILTIILFILIALVVALVLLRLTPIWDKFLSAGEFKPTDFSKLTTTGKPNWYLVCPPEYCSNLNVHLESPVYKLSKTTLADRLKSIVLKDPNIEIRQDDGTKLELVARTPTVRWPDLVSIEFIEKDENSSTLAIYSRAIYGIRDFSANKSRVDRWLKSLRAEIGEDAIDTSAN